VKCEMGKKRTENEGERGGIPYKRGLKRAHKKKKKGAVQGHIKGT